MNQPNTLLNNLKSRYALKSFLIALIVAFAFFIPFIIYDSGYFLYYGDFNVQQIPFYQMVHDSIRSGNFLWSWTTDLGANLIGSYSFYLLGSPFFWVTLLFPSKAVPYLMAPLLITKFACASLGGYIYLKRYVKDRNFAVIGGLLYAFSGFSVYNIFFNHFHEAIILFPFVLAALDEYMYKRRRGVFAVAVFFSCLVNYYFFVGQVVFSLIYWIIKMALGHWKITVKDFIWLIFESILGVLCTSVILIPTVLAVIQNPRVNSPPMGWEALLYSNEQRYLHILQCLFFPPDIPARPNFTPDSNAKWASLGAWLPFIGMSGVIAFMKTKSKHWLKVLISILLVMAFVPVLNSAFQLFNSSYYARWFYMLTLMMSLATIIALENSNTNWNSAVKWSLGITLSIAIPIGLLPTQKTVDGVKKIVLGLMNYPDRFWIYVGISIASIVSFYAIVTFYGDNKSKLIKYTSIGVCIVSVMYSAVIIVIGKSQSYSTHDFIIPHCINSRDKMNLPQSQDYRIDVYGGMDNQAMFWQVPTIQAFHSIVPGSVMEFYPTIDVKRDVASRPGVNVYGLRGLTSCKWLVDYKDNKNFFNEGTGTMMPGWSYYDTQNNFDIWKNDYYIPYGFTFDSYITKEQYESSDIYNRHLLLLKAIVLDNEQEKRHKDILYHIDNTNLLDYSEEGYKRDCKDRCLLTCYDFKRDNTGFSARIDNTKYKDDKLVFFSVPYEDGWSAKVNAEKVDIEKVSIGFMAVRVPGGQNSTIRFDYMTPGLMFGGIISILCILVLTAYMFICFYKYNKNIKKRVIYKVKCVHHKDQ